MKINIVRCHNGFTIEAESVPGVFAFTSNKKMFVAKDQEELHKIVDEILADPNLLKKKES